MAVHTYTHPSTKTNQSAGPATLFFDRHHPRSHSSPPASSPFHSVHTYICFYSTHTTTHIRNKQPMPPGFLSTIMTAHTHAACPPHHRKRLLARVSQPRERDPLLLSPSHILSLRPPVLCAPHHSASFAKQQQQCVRRLSSPLPCPLLSLLVSRPRHRRCGRLSLQRAIT